MSLLSTAASPQVSPGSPVGSGSSLLLPLAQSCAGGLTATRTKPGSQLAQDFEYWGQALRKVAGIQKGGGTQQHSGCPGIAWALQECCTPQLWAPQTRPELKPQEICAISVFPVVFVCKSNPPISLFKSFARFERNRGEAMLGVTQSLRLVLSNPRGKEPGKGKREVGGELRFQELLTAHTGKIILPSLS